MGRLSVRILHDLRLVALDVASQILDAELAVGEVVERFDRHALDTGPGGRVMVRLQDERDRPRPRGTEIEHPLRLTVSDSGGGITSEARTRIFDPFFTTKTDGSGLGLAVVHRAVEAHAGATFVERGPEGGAQFVIFLPAEAEPVPSTGAEAIG